MVKFEQSGMIITVVGIILPDGKQPGIVLVTPIPRTKESEKLIESIVNSIKIVKPEKTTGK